MFVERIFNKPLAINSYIVGDETSKTAVIIDPSRDLTPFLEYIHKNQLTIKAILETHVHADFVSGAKELKQKLGNKPTIHSSAMGGEEWLPKYADHPVKDLDVVTIGSLRLEAWHTPGHTPEHIIWVLYDRLEANHPCIAFTGDLLFIGSVGRPDLLGYNVNALSELLYNSIFDKVLKLPDEVVILPGHGAGSFCGKSISQLPSSTLGEEKQTNPYLKPLEKTAWISRILQDLPIPPKNVKHMKEINLKGIDEEENIMKEIHHLEALNNAELDQFIVDIRPAEEYAKAHLPLSVNIPAGPSFSNWCGSIVPYSQPVVLVGDSIESIEDASLQLKLIGIKVISYYLLNEASIAAHGKQLHSFPVIAAEELAERMKTEEIYVLDVRTPTEWASGHIKNAHSVEFTNVSKELANLPQDLLIATVCARGNRASIAASLLEKNGFTKVCNIKGGMQGWNNANLPTTKD